MSIAATADKNYECSKFTLMCFEVFLPSKPTSISSSSFSGSFNKSDSNCILFGSILPVCLPAQLMTRSHDYHVISPRVCGEMAAKAKSKKNPVQEGLTRIAIVSSDRCKPKKCKQECKKWCPVNRMGEFVFLCCPFCSVVFLWELNF